MAPLLYFVDQTEYLPFEYRSTIALQLTCTDVYTPLEYLDTAPSNTGLHCTEMTDHTTLYLLDHKPIEHRPTLYYCT